MGLDNICSLMLQNQAGILKHALNHVKGFTSAWIIYTTTAHAGASSLVTVVQLQALGLIIALMEVCGDQS
ncbi:hypothetical protein WN943_016647 [Citrus x changshan-huyou]